MTGRLNRAEVEGFRTLLRKEGRAAAGRFLLEGWRALAEASDADIECVAVRADLIDRPELGPLRRRGVPVREVGERDARRMSATEHPQGVVAVARMPPADPAPFRPGDALVVALDAVADPGNLGTILRTASWFGARGVLLGKGGVDPFNDKVVRSTAGALFHVPMLIDVDLPARLDEARAAGFGVAVAAAEGAVELPAWRPARRCVLVLGGEARGASAAVRAAGDVAVSVPRFGRGESLNVAVAAGILLAHARMSV
jgi:TrmH family RNA methyltransferase